MENAHAIRDAIIGNVELRLFKESLPRIIKCLDRMNEEQIWWRPNETSNSVGNLVLHLCGNVSQWIHTGLGGLMDERNRQQEFDAREGINREELLSKMNTTMELAGTIIREVTAEDLLRIRPVQTFQESGLSILIHVTEHFSYHTGQIAYITKMLTDRDLSFYDGVVLQ